MKLRILYLFAFLTISYGVSKYLGQNGLAFGPVLQTKTSLEQLTPSQLTEVLTGSWTLNGIISNEEEELEIIGQFDHHQDGSFNIYYTVTGRDPGFLEFGNRLTSGGRIQGLWHIHDSLAVWWYESQDCSFEISHHEHPFGYFDLCNWLTQNVGLSFGNDEDRLRRQRITHFSKSKITIEKNRFSESTARTFIFTKKE